MVAASQQQTIPRLWMYQSAGMSLFDQGLGTSHSIEDPSPPSLEPSSEHFRYVRELEEAIDLLQNPFDLWIHTRLMDRSLWLDISQ